MAAHVMTQEQKQMARRLKAKGLTLKEDRQGHQLLVAAREGHHLCPAGVIWVGPTDGHRHRAV